MSSTQWNLPLLNFFKQSKKVKVGRCQIWTVRWMFHDFPLQFPEGFPTRIPQHGDKHHCITGHCLTDSSFFQNRLHASALSEACHKRLHFWQLFNIPGSSHENALENSRWWSTSTCLPLAASWIPSQRDDGCVHCMFFWFVSGWQWWIQASLPVTMSSEKLSPSQQWAKWQGMWLCSSVSASVIHPSHTHYATEGYNAPHNWEDQCWYLLIFKFHQLSLFCLTTSVV